MLLAYLGLDLRTMGASSMGMFRLAAGNRYAEAELPFRAVGCSRYRLDQALLDKAEAAGAEVRRGVTVTEITSSDGEVVLKAGADTLKANAVALASGKHNLRQFPRALSDMLGFKLQLRVSASVLAQLQDIVQLMMFDGGYIGAIIVEDEIVTIGWVMHRGLLQRHRRGLAVPGWLSRPAVRAPRRTPRWRDTGMGEAGRGRRHSVRLSSSPSRLAEHLPDRRPARRHPLLHRRRHVDRAALRHRCGASRARRR